MTIRLDDHDFLTALVDVRRAADELRTHERRLTRSVDVLLDGGWSGGAARSYAEGWDLWRAGCADVLAGLDAMADLLAGVRADLVLQDLLAESALDPLTGRVLGGPA